MTKEDQEKIKHMCDKFLAEMYEFGVSSVFVATTVPGENVTTAGYIAHRGNAYAAIGLLHETITVGLSGFGGKEGQDEED